MLEISLALLVIAAAIGGIFFWLRALPAADPSIHTVITKAHDQSAPVGLTNLPQGSRLGAHSGRAAAILTDGTILAESAGGTKAFASLAAYRDYVGDQKALSFGSQPA